MDTLVKKAYENWMHVIEYDGKSLLSLNDNKNSDTSQHDQIVGSQNHSNSYANQLNVPALPSSIPSEQPAMNPGSNIGGKTMFRLPLQIIYLPFRSSVKFWVRVLGCYL